MKKYFKNFSLNPWLKAISFSLVLAALWAIAGWLLSHPFFDKHLSTFKVLQSKSDALTFATVLFAVLIPVFILLLQRMADAGYVRRLVLPSVIQFRELLFGYITLSLLLLISPRASYYYLPVTALTTLGFYAVYDAVRVMFEPRKLRDKETKFVTDTVTKVMAERLVHRISSNDFMEYLKSTKGPVTYTLLDFGSRQEDSRSIDIRAKVSGQILSIDVPKFEESLLREYSSSFSEIKDNSGQESLPQNNLLPKLVLRVRPGSTIKKKDPSMQLILPKGVDNPSEKAINELIGAVDIRKEAPYSADRNLDDLIVDFKQQLRDGIDKDSTVSLQQSLDFYLLLLQGYSRFSEVVADSGYTFANAREEFHQFIGDSASKQITALSDIFNDELQYAIREKRQDTARGLISFAYGELLGASRNFEVLRAAFADDAMVHAVNRLIFIDTEDSFSDEVFDYIMTRLKENTGLLLYSFRDREDDSNITKAQLEEWLRRRLSDAKDFLLGTYKKSKPNYFKQSLGILEEFEKDMRYFEHEMEELATLERCYLLMLSTYMHGKRENEGQKLMHEAVDAMVNPITPQELTRLLIECVNKNYSDQWRFDTYDLPADGEMHSVPDYDQKLKATWADYMLNSSFPTQIDQYGDLKLGETLTFSDGRSKPEESFLVQHLDELISKNTPNAQELKALVLEFIQKRTEWEQTTLAEAELSSEKVIEFQEDILKGYESRALAITIFKAADKLKEVQRADKTYKMFGWNQIQDKAAFIESWHIGYAMIGSQYGSEIAMRQNEIIVESLLSNRTELHEFDEWIDKIKDGQNWVLFNVDVGNWYIRSHFENYLKKDEPYNEIYYKGVAQQGPSNHIYLDSVPKGLYAVRTDHLGTLNIKTADGKLIEIAVDAYSHNEDLLKAILDKPPDWLKKKGTRGQQEDFLKTMIRMYIYQTFKFTAHPNPKVYFLPITDEMA